MSGGGWTKSETVSENGSVNPFLQYFEMYDNVSGRNSYLGLWIWKCSTAGILFPHWVEIPQCWLLYDLTAPLLCFCISVNSMRKKYFLAQQFIFGPFLHGSLGCLSSPFFSLSVYTLWIITEPREQLASNEASTIQIQWNGMSCS